MGDVLEFLIDGTSGLSPGGVDGKAIVAGCCSLGRVGKGYLIGKRTDLSATLGTGPLVDRVRDILATAGQEPVLVAVPVRGQPGGYFTLPVCTGGSGNEPEIRVSGVPQINAEIVLEVVTAGPVGTSTVKISTNGGATFAEPVTTAAQMVIAESGTSGMTGAAGTTGATVLFPATAELDTGWRYRFTSRCAIGPVSRVGAAASPLPIFSGEPLAGGAPLAGADVTIRIVKSGKRNEGTYQLSVDGGDNFDKIRTIPYDGIVRVPTLAVSVSFPEGTYTGGTTYACRILPPAPSIVDVMSALESPLEVYDVEFVHVVGPSDSVDWAAAAAKVEDLWNRHRPTYFKMETRLPHDGEDLNDFTAWLLTERANFAARFVQVCCQFGEIAESTGQRKLRNWAGLQAGRSMAIPVMRATGRVRDGNIIQGTLPEGWDAVQPILEEAGFLTAKKYAGLQGAYWGDSRTMADDTSDYRFEEVVRTAFKAVRKLRIAALKSMYDEAGDPLLGANANGLAYLKANLENALATMTRAIPPELIDYVVDIPPGQDIVNNGVAVEHTLIGVPIIRQIKLYAKYVYAGSVFDPRLAN